MYQPSFNFIIMTIQLHEKKPQRGKRNTPLLQREKQKENK